MTRVKICGLKDPENLKVAVNAGADFIGFVFYPPSPRAITPEIAAGLTAQIPASVKSVGVFVDPEDDEIAEVLASVKLGMIQLHGTETPQRVKDIRYKFEIPIIKAIGVRDSYDLKDVNALESCSDWLLFDARPENVILPGGTGEVFDWALLRGLKFHKPWMLSGGLNAQNVPEVLAILKPNAVDVSSGVESGRGQKDPEKICAFIDAAKIPQISTPAIP